jgi:hypothetical protein
MEDKILGALASALKMDAQELLADLKTGDDWAENAVDTLSAKIRAQLKAAQDTQYKRGIREKGKATEKFFASMGFENPDKLEGDEYLDAAREFLESKVPEGGADPVKLDREALSKLPEVKALISEAKTAAGQRLSELETAISQKEKQFRQERVKDIAAAKLPEILEAHKVILDAPGVEGSKSARIAAVQAQIDWSKVAIDDKRNLVFVDDDGNPATDEFGKPVDFSKHVVSVAAPMFGIQTQDPHRGGGRPAGTGGGAGGSQTWTFENAAAFDKAIMSEGDPGKRADMRRAFLEQAAT